MTMSDEMSGLFTLDTDTLNEGGFAVDVINLALHWGVLVPDSTLQAIATEVRKHPVWFDDLTAWPALHALLEALEGDNEQIPFSKKIPCPNCGATGRGCVSTWCYGKR